jgi:hypothetical protein
MTDDLLTGLLPGLGRSSKAGFNVFDVMRHGTHEKQISNVFGWLLDAEGTHNLGDLFQRIFIDELNRGRADQELFAHGPYLVRQEVNTSGPEDGQDIADLVLENDEERLVIENYFTSDGHGHSFDSYRQFARRDGRRGAVALLCRDEDSSRQTGGWEQASVVTYDKVVIELRQRVASDYQKKNPESYSLIDQMHRKFAGGRRHVEDQEVLQFLTVMCATGEASRYREQSQDTAALKFADDVANQAVERFGEGRELLQRVKGRLKTHCARVLQDQLNATMGANFVTKVSATYAGIYQWTVNLEVIDEGEEVGEAKLQLKFGPSAWFANEQDATWRRTVDLGAADYSHLFLTRARFREIRQSAVTLQEVLAGIGSHDLRLHDEIVLFWRSAGL